MTTSNPCTGFINKYYPVFEPAFEYIVQKKISIISGISGGILGNGFANTALYLSKSEYGLAGYLIVNLTGTGAGGALFALAGKVVEGYLEAKKMNFQFPESKTSKEGNSSEVVGEAVDEINLTDLALNKA